MEKEEKCSEIIVDGEYTVRVVSVNMKEKHKDQQLITGGNHAAGGWVRTSVRETGIHKKI